MGMNATSFVLLSFWGAPFAILINRQYDYSSAERRIRSHKRHSTSKSVTTILICNSSGSYVYHMPLRSIFSAVVVKFYLGDAKNLTTFFSEAGIFDDPFLGREPTYHTNSLAEI
jgi:hypothetical protein